MAARYYNISKHEPATGSRQLIQLTECNASGVALESDGTDSIFEFGSIRFIPNATTGGHFNIISLMGDISVPFTFDNVINFEDAEHEQTNTYDLYIVIGYAIIA